MSNSINVTNILQNANVDLCSVDSDTRKLLRFIDSNPQIAQGSKIIFSTIALCLKPWFLNVEDYSFQSVDLSVGELSELNINANFLMVKVDWGATAAAGDKRIEITLPESQGYIGSVIPYPIGGTGSTQSYTNIALKDLYMINSQETFDEIKINNTSTKEKCVVNIFTATKK